jgi:uncharacterized membrane protein YdbT with pleckstrin-like domain
MPKSYLETLLGQHEKIILVSRQHGFTLASAILLEIVAISMLIAILVVAQIYIPDFIPAAKGILPFGYLLLLIPLFTLARDILDWSNREYVVTNRRVMQIAGIINKNVTDSSLEKVNDVKMVQSVMGRLFDYGDIEILTASELGVNLFRRIGHPVKFKIAMLNAKEQLEHSDEGGGRGNDIPSLIASLDLLRKHGLLTEAEFRRKKEELLARV